MYTSAAYRSSPVWLQEGMLSARALVRRRLREGRHLDAELRDVEASQWLDTAQLEALQLQRLRATINHAIQHVPFYRDLYRRHGVDGAAIASLGDVGKLPIIDKTQVVAAGVTMHSEHRRGPRFLSTSSGTTGSYVAAYRDLHSIVRENAFIVRQLHWAGVSLEDRRVWIRGDKIVPSGDRSGPFWRHNLADHTLMMSAYHLSEPRTAAYVEAMEDFDPVAIQAYPSAIVFIANVLEASGRKYGGRNLRAIVTSSETITDVQKRQVQRVFGCPVFDWYGNFERVAAIGTCEHQRYHLISDYSYVELQPDKTGGCEIVGTSFDNLAMPWIRYRVEDLVVPDRSGRSCECRRAFPLIATIEGRAQDYLVAPHGRRIVMPINAFDDIQGLLEGQFVQTVNTSVDVLCRLAAGAATTSHDIESIVRAYVGPDLGIHVKIVTEIPRTSSGKLRTVIRTVDQ
ncbi:MAG: hypothetical protein ABL964_01390 [Steroidobacteraceae bacterium]